MSEIDKAIRKDITDCLRATVYTCSRVWSAWQVGTMTEDDFSPAWEDEDLISELEGVVLDAIHAANDRRVSELRKSIRESVVSLEALAGKEAAK